VVYVTRLREFLETRHTHCPCSHVNGLAEFMDMGDVAGLIAPRPQLLLTAEQDESFTPAGARAAAEQARGAYAAFGAGERLRVRSFDSEHDYGREMREALYGWLARHLQGAETAEPVGEPELLVEPDAQALLCFADGALPTGNATVRSLAHERAVGLAGAVPRDVASIRADLRRAVGQAPPTAVDPLELDPGLVDLLRELNGAGERTPIAFGAQAGSRFSGWRIHATSSDAPLVVIFSDEALDQGSSLITAAASIGSEVVVLSCVPRRRSDGHLLATDAHLLGDSLLVRRARTMGSVLLGLREREAKRRPLICIADGPRATLALLIAQAAWGEADALGLRGAPASMLQAFEGGPPAPSSFAWRLLHVGDMTDLSSAAGIPVVPLDRAPSDDDLADLFRSVGQR